MQCVRAEQWGAVRVSLAGREQSAECSVLASRAFLWAVVSAGAKDSTCGGHDPFCHQPGRRGIQRPHDAVSGSENCVDLSCAVSCIYVFGAGSKPYSHGIRDGPQRRKERKVRQGFIFTAEAQRTRRTIIIY